MSVKKNVLFRIRVEKSDTGVFTGELFHSLSKVFISRDRGYLFANGLPLPLGHFESKEQNYSNPGFEFGVLDTVDDFEHLG